MKDQHYWKTFYQKNNDLSQGSAFCRFVLDYFKENKDIQKVLDSGCGNGRDSRVLAQRYDVDAVDNCGVVLENDHFNFRVENFIDNDKTAYDLVYSRFTFHSISNEEHQTFLESITAGTYLAIEARSKKGEDQEVHYGKTHYRNYIDLPYLEILLKKTGFDIKYLREGKDMAKYKEENPICIRVIALKHTP